MVHEKVVRGVERRGILIDLAHDEEIGKRNRIRAMRSVIEDRLGHIGHIVHTTPD